MRLQLYIGIICSSMLFSALAQDVAAEALTQDKLNKLSEALAKDCISVAAESASSGSAIASFSTKLNNLTGLPDLLRTDPNTQKEAINLIDLGLLYGQQSDAFKRFAEVRTVRRGSLETLKTKIEQGDLLTNSEAQLLQKIVSSWKILESAKHPSALIQQEFADWLSKPILFPSLDVEVRLTSTPNGPIFSEHTKLNLEVIYEGGLTVRVQDALLKYVENQLPTLEIDWSRVSIQPNVPPSVMESLSSSLEESIPFGLSVKSITPELNGSKPPNFLVVFNASGGQLFDGLSFVIEARLGIDGVSIIGGGGSIPGAIPIGTTGLMLEGGGLTYHGSDNSMTISSRIAPISGGWSFALDAELNVPLDNFEYVKFHGTLRAADIAIGEIVDGEITAKYVKAKLVVPSKSGDSPIGSDKIFRGSLDIMLDQDGIKGDGKVVYFDTANVDCSFHMRPDASGTIDASGDIELLQTNLKGEATFDRGFTDLVVTAAATINLSIEGLDVIRARVRVIVRDAAGSPSATIKTSVLGQQISFTTPNLRASLKELIEAKVNVEALSDHLIKGAKELDPFNKNSAVRKGVAELDIFEKNPYAKQIRDYISNSLQTKPLGGIVTDGKKQWDKFVGSFSSQTWTESGGADNLNAADIKAIEKQRDALVAIFEELQSSKVTAISRRLCAPERNALEIRNIEYEIEFIELVVAMANPNSSALSKRYDNMVIAFVMNGIPVSEHPEGAELSSFSKWGTVEMYYIHPLGIHCNIALPDLADTVDGSLHGPLFLHIAKVVQLQLDSTPTFHVGPRSKMDGGSFDDGVDIDAMARNTGPPLDVRPSLEEVRLLENGSTLLRRCGVVGNYFEVPLPPTGHQRVLESLRLLSIHRDKWELTIQPTLDGQESILIGRQSDSNANALKMEYQLPSAYWKHLLKVDLTSDDLAVSEYVSLNNPSLEAWENVDLIFDVPTEDQNPQNDIKREGFSLAPGASALRTRSALALESTEIKVAPLLQFDSKNVVDHVKRMHVVTSEDPDVFSDKWLSVLAEESASKTVSMETLTSLGEYKVLPYPGTESTNSHIMHDKNKTRVVNSAHRIEGSVLYYKPLHRESYFTSKSNPPISRRTLLSVSIPKTAAWKHGNCTIWLDPGHSHGSVMVQQLPINPSTSCIDVIHAPIEEVASLAFEDDDTVGRIVQEIVSCRASGDSRCYGKLCCPELLIESFVVDNTDLSTGDHVMLILTIKNVGGKSAYFPMGSVIARGCGARIVSRNVGGCVVSPNQSSTFRHKINSEQLRGIGKLKFIVDPNNRVREWFEDNNVYHIPSDRGVKATRSGSAAF